MPQSLDHNQLVQLRDLIHQSFNLDEFRTLCFDIGVRYDDLPGEGLRARVTELVSLCDRTGRIEHLLARCIKLRPHTNWLGLNEAIKQESQSSGFTPPVQNPRQIFISYAFEDTDFAHRLADDLRQRGWVIWIAPESIHPGDEWIDAINRGLAGSSVFLLLLTPHAINSSMVKRETNAAIGLEHQNKIRLLPLDVAPGATPPPLWQTYQWIPFQNNYKDGLEQLMKGLQPEQMIQLEGWYSQMQQAMGRNDWALAQKLGEQIRTTYPDFRETEERLALARREAEREQANQAEAAHLYPRLQAALDASDWNNALTLAEQINTLSTNYKNVNQLAERARHMKRQEQQEQAKQGESAQLYMRLTTAIDTANWTNALALAEQINNLVPNYKDVPQLVERAQHGKQNEEQINSVAQNDQYATQPKKHTQRGFAKQPSLQNFTPHWTSQEQFKPQAKQWFLRYFTPHWTPWSLGIVFDALLIACVGTAFLLSQLSNSGEKSTPTASWTRSVVVTIELTTPTSTLTPSVTATATDTTQPTPSRTITPTWGPTPTLDPNIPPPNPQLHSTWSRPTDGMMMVFVPGGTFLMGSAPDVDEDARDNEQPQHEVTLTDFWIDRTEVTNAMYTQCVAHGPCTISTYANNSNLNGANYPVVGVSWSDANNYCEWADGRVNGKLPTEAQWEYAARGNEGRLYPWGNELPTCDLAQYDNCDGNTVPVGTFSPTGDSWVGAADMAGNVWEWVADWYDSDYYMNSPTTNPTGPTSGSSKVLRGGSWDVLYLSLVFRADADPGLRLASSGFRCIVSLVD